MADSKKDVVQPVVDETNNVEIPGLEKVKGIWDANRKPITYVGLGLLALILGWFGYSKFIKEPKQAQANEAIWHAEDYFAKDSIKLALNGDGQFAGFEKVAKNFSGTETGNRAKYLAGVCALKLGDFKKAIEHLEGFSTNAKEVQALAYARLADAYGETGKNEDAIKYYLKAVSEFPEQETIGSESLFLAANKCEILKKKDDAIKYFKQLLNDYPNSEKGRQAEKYLARLGVTE
jgi:TolA-binding protein